ncbi:MAG: glycosyltransferase family 4 protein [Rhodobacteraceae bacterium]|nr:glycosyltransferase family 4 protein [Paracoccaceae bacterium]
MPDSQHVMVHDYAGHPFTAEFARALAGKGWRVTYVYFAGDEGPKGRNARLPDDPDSFSAVPLAIDGAYSKSNFFKRRQGDIAYGKRLAQLVADVQPDIVLSGNTPTECQEYLVRACAQTGAQFIYWCQDFYSIAAARILSKKLPGLGHAIGAYYTYLERRQMRNAAHVIHITDGFVKVTDRWGIPRARVSVIPNWGVIDEIPLLPRETDWSAKMGLTRAKRVVYSGTLANKHNPDFLAQLAQKAGADLDVIVVGFGVGAERLAKRRAELPNLKVLPLQPFAEFPQVLASADVLVAVIEADAGEFSVPSKVLSYLCAGRPIVLAAPKDNLAAQMILQAGAGLVVGPDDKQGFINAVQTLLSDGIAAAEMGKAARAYAEQNFDLDHVTDRFEKLLVSVMVENAGQNAA